MRLLHLINSLRPGGAETHLARLLPELVRAGHEVSVGYLYEGSPSIPDLLRGASVRVAWLRGSLRRPAKTYFQINRLLREGGFDLVHTHLPQCDMLGGIAALINKMPWVVTLHIDFEYLDRFPYRLTHPPLLRKTGALIAVSEAVRDFVSPILGMDRTGLSNRIVVIHHGLNGDVFCEFVSPTDRQKIRNEFGIPDGAFLLGSVGRLAVQKGHKYLIAAIDTIAETGIPVHLALVGDGPLRPNLLQQSSEIGWGSRVHFLGKRFDVPNVMAAFDVFVHPSLWEGFGIVLLEAMALGLPIVASDVCAIPEIVSDGQTGLLVPPGDSHGLAAAIIRLYRDRKLAKGLGQAGRSRLAQHFSLDEMVRKMIEVYEELLQRSV